MARMLRIVSPLPTVEARFYPDRVTIHTPKGSDNRVKGVNKMYFVIGGRQTITLARFCIEHGIALETFRARFAKWPPGDYHAPFWDAVRAYKASVLKRTHNDSDADFEKGSNAARVRFILRKAQASSRRIRGFQQENDDVHDGEQADA
jgi:hypothetical protein